MDEEVLRQRAGSLVLISSGEVPRSRRLVLWLEGYCGSVPAWLLVFVAGIVLACFLKSPLTPAKKSSHSVPSPTLESEGGDGFKQRPWESGEFAAEPLDSDRRAFLVSEFLDEAEIDHFIKLGDSMVFGSVPADWEKSAQFGFRFFYLTDDPKYSGPDAPRMKEADPVLLRVEQRIGRLTGVPPHDGEEPKMPGGYQPRLSEVAYSRRPTHHPTPSHPLVAESALPSPPPGNSRLSFRRQSWVR